MKIALKNLASIQTGIYEKPNLTGEVVYLQAKNFNEDGRLYFDVPPSLNINNKVQKNLLVDGDVLFNARGVKNFAIKYNAWMGVAVASSTFMVVRIKSSYWDKILPEYLIWYINLPQIQAYFKSAATGTSLPSISKSVLEDLEVPVPSIEIQDAIVSSHQLRRQEKQITARIEELKEQLTQHQLLSAATRNL